MLYLDDANKENGCLSVIPGSHRFGTLPSLEDRGGTLGALYTEVEGVEGWHGVPYGKPLTRTREYIQIIRQGES